MNRWNAALAIVLAAALGACRSSAEKTTAEGASPAPPATALASPGAAYAPAPATGLPEEGTATTAGAPPVQPPAAANVEPVPQERPTTTTSNGRAARKPASRSTVRRSPSRHPVERIEQPIADEPLPRTRGERTARNEEDERAEPAGRDRLSLPAGTELRLVLENALSSETSQDGDRVTARVERAYGPDGTIVLPGGTVLKGRVYRAESAGRVKGRSHLGVDFDAIVIRGAEHRLDTTAIEVEGPDSHGRDAAIIGGSTAGGAIIGGILDGGKGARKGAVIGAVGGAGAVLATRGKEIDMPAGSRWTVKVKDGVRLN